MSIEVTAEPFVIHVGVEESLFLSLSAVAHAQGMRVIELDLAGVQDATALSNYLATAFAFPHATRGLDAAIDLISDLEWLGSPGGYMILALGLENQPPVASLFASLLPNIVDRWRSQDVPFVAVLGGAGGRIVATLRAANSELERAGRLPWAQPGTGAVKVVVHDASTSAAE